MLLPFCNSVTKLSSYLWYLALLPSCDLVDNLLLPLELIVTLSPWNQLVTVMLRCREFIKESHCLQPGTLLSMFHPVITLQTPCTTVLALSPCCYHVPHGHSVVNLSHCCYPAHLMRPCHPVKALSAYLYPVNQMTHCYPVYIPGTLVLLCHPVFSQTSAL
jgi:hypothetical protein